MFFFDRSLNRIYDSPKTNSKCDETDTAKTDLTGETVKY